MCLLRRTVLEFVERSHIWYIDEFISYVLCLQAIVILQRHPSSDSRWNAKASNQVLHLWTVQEIIFVWCSQPNICGKIY